VYRCEAVAGGAGTVSGLRHPQAHENHEVAFMIVPYWLAAAARIMPGTRSDSDHPPRRLNMKWETPEAIDMRFGMEITMYIANR
jgi:coenzyme PQQ precursor peptide PqqA